MDVVINRAIIKKDSSERVVVGEVFAPMRADTYGDVMTPEEIRKSAYNFMRNMRLDQIDTMHNLERSGSYVVESTIIRHDGDPDGFLKGSWVLAVKIEDDAIWQKVLSGELNGFSLYGYGNQEKVKVKVERVTEIIGITDLSFEGVFPEHTHDFHIKFDENDKIIPTLTSEVLGHTHELVQATATEESFEHSHRFSLSE